MKGRVLPPDRSQLEEIVRASEIILAALYDVAKVDASTRPSMTAERLASSLPEDLAPVASLAVRLLQDERLAVSFPVSTEHGPTVEVHLTSAGALLMAKRACVVTEPATAAPASWWLATARAARKIRYPTDAADCAENQVRRSKVAEVERIIELAADDLVAWCQVETPELVPVAPRIAGWLDAGTMELWLRSKGARAVRHPLRLFARDLRTPLCGSRIPLLDEVVGRWKAAWLRDHPRPAPELVPPPADLVQRAFPEGAPR